MHSTTNEKTGRWCFPFPHDSASPLSIAILVAGRLSFNKGYTPTLPGQLGLLRPLFYLVNLITISFIQLNYTSFLYN